MYIHGIKLNGMNWIEVTDQNQLPHDGTSILAQDECGNIGYVYWNSYDWVYNIPGLDDEIWFSGKVARYIILD